MERIVTLAREIEERSSELRALLLAQQEGTVVSPPPGLPPLGPGEPSQRRHPGILGGKDPNTATGRNPGRGGTGDPLRRPLSRTVIGSLGRVSRPRMQGSVRLDRELLQKERPLADPWEEERPALSPQPRFREAFPNRVQAGSVPFSRPRLPSTPGRSRQRLSAPPPDCRPLTHLPPSLYLAFPPPISIPYDTPRSMYFTS